MYKYYVCVRMYFQPGPVTQEGITGYQVSYSVGTMIMTVTTNSTTTLTFTPPTLPDDMFTGTVVVKCSDCNQQTWSRTT